MKAEVDVLILNCSAFTLLRDRGMQIEEIAGPQDVIDCSLENGVMSMRTAVVDVQVGDRFILVKERDVPVNELMEVKADFNRRFLRLQAEWVLVPRKDLPQAILRK